MTLKYLVGLFIPEPETLVAATIIVFEKPEQKFIFRSRRKPMPEVLRLDDGDFLQDLC